MIKMMDECLYMGIFMRAPHCALLLWPYLALVMAIFLAGVMFQRNRADPSCCVLSFIPFPVPLHPRPSPAT